LRVSFVVPRYLPHLGGIENHVAAIASRLQQRGHQVTVATQLEGDDSLTERELSADGVLIRRFSSAGQLRGHGVSRSLLAWVRAGADQADVVHLHNFHAVATLANVFVARRPFVFTPHYLGPGEGKAELALHSGYSAVMRRALRRVSRIICVTPSEAELFGARVGYADRCRIIPNGVDTLAIAAAAPVELAGRLLVVAGRLEEYKQPQLVIEALAELPADFRLAIIGGGPMLEQLHRRSVALGVEDRVLFPGRLPPTELHSWFRRADVVLSMSRRECFGLTIAEGLAAGAAIVASDIGAHRDVVAASGSSAAGLLPAKATPKAIAAAVRAAGARAETPVPVTVTGWDDVALQTEALYRELRS
jgi:glycosyltransferase involved in cell wall biosynthesis